MALAALENRVMMPDGTLVPWTSPAHGTPMRIAAAAPEIPWTDLANSLLPNGHTLDYVTDAPYMKRGRIGVMKQSFVAGLYALGKASSNYAAPGTDPDADLDSWYALINAGEPYDQNPQATDIVDEVTTHHSSYYIDHSIAPAPLLISNGGTDDLFPVDEAVRFYNRTRSEYPGADIALFFLDYGHQRGENKSADVALLHQQQDAWFDYYLKGVGPTPFHGVTALTQNCGGASEGPYSAPSWADLAPGEIRLSSAAAQTIVPGSGDSSRGRTYDPISGGGACATADGSDQTGVASYRLDPAPAGGFTLAGATTIVADINSAGPTSQIAARLLDVASDGSATLVARGLYRPEINSGTDPTHQVFQLHPNAYHFAEGHVAKLELLPADAPYGRVSNGQATVTVSNLELRLPVLEQPNGTLVQPPAPKVVPPGYQLAFCSSDGDCDDANVCNGAETCVDHACVAGTQLDCDDHDPCTTDTCDASGGCAHAPSCAPLAITRAMIRTGVGRGFITVKGTLTTPPALSGNPPVGVEVQDSSGHDQARTFTSCTVRGTRVRCSDTVSLVILKGVGAGPGTVKLGVKLRQLTLAPPLAGPVTVRLTHDGVGHRGSISTCGVVGSSLRCSSR
jgi:hypothetical protein